jgi:hypothetical protein
MGLAEKKVLQTNIYVDFMPVQPHPQTRVEGVNLRFEKVCCSFAESDTRQTFFISLRLFVRLFVG